MIRHSITMLALLIISVALIPACKKSDSASSGSYTVPDTYNFTGMDSLGAKTILSMIGEMELAINKGNTSGTVVSAAALKNMYRNESAPFTDTSFDGAVLSLNASPLSLKASTSASAQSFVENMLDSIELASSSDEPAGNGVAGVSSRQTLLSSNGVFWRQLFTKTMMGTVIGHLITDVYLTDSLNNSATIAQQAHAWDQAFFLWCVPSNFPSNRKGVKYWGSYTSQIDSGIAKPVSVLTGINSNTTLLSAFLKGRAALANNDQAAAMQQAAIIIPFFETMEAAAALHETNEAKGNLANSSAAVVGNLSESLGFWTSLKFNAHKKISDADLQAVEELYGADLWNITPAGIQAIQDRISYIYGWDNVKSNL